MNELINKLKQMNKGANVHTINKAVFYLEKAQNLEYESKLPDMVRKALNTGDWGEVKKYMKNWF